MFFNPNTNYLIEESIRKDIEKTIKLSVVIIGISLFTILGKNVYDSVPAKLDKIGLLKKIKKNKDYPEIRLSEEISKYNQIIKKADKELETNLVYWLILTSFVGGTTLMRIKRLKEIIDSK